MIVSESVVNVMVTVSHTWYCLILISFLRKILRLPFLFGSSLTYLLSYLLNYLFT